MLIVCDPTLQVILSEDSDIASMADRHTDRLDSNLGAAPDVFWHLTVKLCYRYNDAIRDVNDVPRVLFQADQHQCRVVGIDVASLSSSA